MKKPKIVVLINKTNGNGGVNRRSRNLVNALSENYLVFLHKMNRPDKAANQSLIRRIKFYESEFRATIYAIKSCDLCISFSLLPNLINSLNTKKSILVMTGDIWIGDGNIFSKLIWGLILQPISIWKTSAIAPAAPHLVNKNIINRCIGRKKQLHLYGFFRPLQMNVHGQSQIKKHILYVGTLDKNKGLMEAIKIYLMFKKMVNIHASSQKFIILGEGPEKSRAIDYIKNQEAKQRKSILGKDIIFKGNKSNAESYFQSASILLHPSKSEGLSNVIIEALYYGCSVLASDCEGNSFLKMRLESLSQKPIKQLILRGSPNSTPAMKMWANDLFVLSEGGNSYENLSTSSVQGAVLSAFGAKKMAEDWLNAVDKCLSN